MATNQQLSITQVRSYLIATYPADPVDSTINELQNHILSKLNENEDGQITGVILDVSAVQVIDSFFARTIIETAQMIELMGASPVLVGISPSIAVTATELGYTLGDIASALDTDRAIDMLSDGDQ